MEIWNSVSNNDRQSGRNEANYELKYHDDDQKVDMQLSKNEVDSEDDLQDIAAEKLCSWDVKEEKDEKHDVLEASMMILCSAQDALEREVHNLKDVGKNGPFEGLDTSEASNILKQNVVHQDLKTEVQSMSKAIQVDQSETIEQQKKLASEQMDVMNRLEVAESKTTELKKQSEKLKATSEEISNKEEVWLARNSVCKLTSLFGIQLILFGLVVYLFVLQLSSHEKEVVVACT